MEELMDTHLQYIKLKLHYSLVSTNCRTVSPFMHHGRIRYGLQVWVGKSNKSTGWTHMPVRVSVDQ
jgi:hypothetical protein